jgi:Tfp pilus assembly protein PilO
MIKRRLENPWARMGLIAGIEVALLLGWYLLYMRPTQARIDHLRQQRLLLTGKVHGAEMAAIQVRRLQGRVDSLEAALDGIRARLVESKYLDEVVAKLAQHARTCGVAFTSVEPDYGVLVEGKAEGPVVRLPLRIQATGPFFSLGRFLDKLPEMDFFLEPTGTILQYDPGLYPKLRIYLSCLLYLRGSELPASGSAGEAGAQQM